MLTPSFIIFLVACFIIISLYDRWKQKNPEYIQAKQQARKVKEYMGYAESYSKKYDLYKNYLKYVSELKKDMQLFLINKDAYNPQKLIISDCSDSNPFMNHIFSLIFFYICDMPQQINNLSLSNSNSKNDFITMLDELELSNNGISPQGACEMVLKKFDKSKE